MVPCTLSRHSAIPRTAVSEIARSRQRTLAELYSRRDTLEKLIHALETYDRNVKAVSAKVIALR
jgi:hypothetical protein